MFGKPQFYGTATVGERGQIVLPAEVRKKYKIEAGEKLLVMGNPHIKAVMLVKAEVLGNILEHLNTDISGVLEEVNK